MRARIWVALLLPAVFFALLTGALHAAGPVLGEGAIFYRWSALEAFRLSTVLYLLPGIALLAGGTALAGANRTLPAALALATLGLLYTGVWAWASLPRAATHHLINFTSPAQDGAFVNESIEADSWESYLRKYPQRMSMSVEQMRGSRVLSNPPGMTLVALALRHTETPPWMIDSFLAELGGERTWRFETALKASFLLSAAWLLSAFPLYLAARGLLPPAGAVAATACAVFGTATLAFSPGKDPAQALFVALQLWGAILACRGAAAPTRLAGALLLGAASATGAGLGLILLWTGLAVGIWSLWEAARRGGYVASVITFVGAAAGAAIACAAFRASLGWDLVETTRLVARNYPEVQKTIRVTWSTWYAIGLPLWLFMAPVALFSALLLRRRGLRRRTSPGVRLMACTAAVMAVTYLAGVPYELPRLWIPFLPLLVVGAFAAAPTLQLRGRGAARVAAALLAAHLLASAVQYSFLDVRESEYRLRTHRGYD